MRLEMRGFDEIQKKLHDLEVRAKQMGGEHKVPVIEVLTVEFMRQHTKFGSFGEMIEASGQKVESAEDFAAIPDDVWDEFVRKNTKFESWNAMLSAAGAQWAQKKMGLK